jgi:hypothetical protein
MSHSGEYEAYGLLGSNAMQFGKNPNASEAYIGAIFIA